MWRADRGDVLDVVVGLVILEVAVAIALWNARASEDVACAVGRGAIAGNGPDHFGLSALLSQAYRPASACAPFVVRSTTFQPLP